MADIGNQLEGVGDGLDRFLDALDNASYKLGSNAALQATQARAAKKMQNQDIRFKKRMDKIETDHAKQIKTMQPVYKKLWTGIKDEVKQRSLLSKGMKDMTKSMTDFAKKAIGGLGKGIAAVGKAGVIGGLVVGVKFLIDGLLKVDSAMAGLVKRTKLTRAELNGVKEAAMSASMSVGLMGPTFEQITAEAGNLVETFGRASMVSERLIKDSLALQQGYGVAAGEAGKLTEALERTARSGEEFRNTIRNIAGKDGVSASLLMRSMAGQAQQIAIQGERGTESMAKMAAFALKAGVSLQDMQGMKAAFSDIDSIAEGLGQAGVIMGEEFRMAMGNAEELYELNLRGATGREQIQKRLMKAMKETTYYDEKSGELYHKSGKPLAEMEGYMDRVSGFAGQTTEALLLGTREMHKQHLGIQKVISDQEHLETVYRDQLGVLEYFGKIASSVFGKITTAFSEALGIDNSEGGVRALLKKLEGDMEDIFQFKTLRKDIASGGGGFGGFVDAMAKRLEPLFDYLKDKFIQAMEMAFAWVGDNIHINTKAFLPSILGGNDDPLISTKSGTARGKIGALVTGGGAGGFADMAMAAAPKKTIGSGRGTRTSEEYKNWKTLNDALTDLEFGITESTEKNRVEVEHANKLERQWAAAQLDAGIDINDIKMRDYRTMLKNAQEQKGEEFRIQDYSLADLKVLADQTKTTRAAETAQLIKDAQIADDKLKADKAEEKVIADRLKNIKLMQAQLARENISLELTNKYQKKLEELQKEAAAHQAKLAAAAARAATKKLADDEAEAIRIANPRALGGIGGGLSIVGEAGGEVVASRSALRSGIGIGGRAASALAGIGVPGYREGYARMDVSGIHGRQGLSGAQGSQEFRQARASAFEQEQLRQQAAMLNYWRNTYDQKMDALIDETKREKKKGPPWLATMFLKYNKEIGEQLKKTGPTVSAALMTGMTKWAQGGSISDAINAGAKAGIVAGLNDPTSKLNDLLVKTGKWQSTLTAGLTAFASGGNVGRSMVGAGSHALAGMIGGGSASKRAAEYMGMSMAAKGKYVNSPTLMMVGEEGRGEVVIPTERIRKGLPINKGVANELGSIGVPGFSGTNNSSINTSQFDFGIGGPQIGSSTIPTIPKQSQPALATPSLGIGKSAVRSRSSGYGSGVSGRFDDLGGFGGMAKAGGAAGLMTFGNIFQQTGDWKQAATGGVGAGIGVGAGMGLTALGIPPPLSGMVGNMIGGLATKGLNSVFNITGGYGKGRRKTLKMLESHIKTGGRFDYGAPSGLNKAMGQAIGGYEKTPTEANFQKLTEKLGTSRLVSSMGVPAPALIALGMGQMRGEAATKLFSSINTSLYGKDGGDKYRNALAIPSLAAGGIVNRPTTALIGEAGPEAVIPLRDSEMVQELKKQNKLMVEMIKTQKETAKTEIRMDGRIVAETVGQNMYNIGAGM